MRSTRPCEALAVDSGYSVSEFESAPTRTTRTRRTVRPISIWTVRVFASLCRSTATTLFRLDWIRFHSTWRLVDFEPLLTAHTDDDISLLCFAVGRTFCYSSCSLLVTGYRDMRSADWCWFCLSFCEEREETGTLPFWGVCIYRRVFVTRDIYAAAAFSRSTFFSFSTISYSLILICVII